MTNKSVYALKTYDIMQNIYNIAYQPFLKSEENIYQYVRDIDFNTEIYIDRNIDLYLIEFANSNEFKNNKNNHNTVCKFVFRLSDYELNKLLDNNNLSLRREYVDDKTKQRYELNVSVHYYIDESNMDPNFKIIISNPELRIHKI